MSGLEAWKRRMVAVGILLLLGGVVAMVGGGLYAGRQQYRADGDVMAGIWVGTAGTLAVVTGVVVAKLGMFGPYPKQFAHEASLGLEADD